MSSPAPHPADVDALRIRDDPVFVIGYQRSGTTMLRLMINRHPDVFIPREGDSFERLPPLLRGSNPGPAEADAVAELLLSNSAFAEIADRDHLVALLRANLPMDSAGVIACLYQACAMPDERGLRWGDKKPQQVWQFVGRLERWYPGSQYVHIVRDPRAVIASIERFIARGVEFSTIQSSRLFGALPSHVWFAWQWRHAFEHVRRVGAAMPARDAAGGRRYWQIRYEDLVTDPEPVIVGLCEFLALEDSHLREMLAFHLDADDPRIAQPYEQFMAETKRELNPDQIGKWRGELDPAVAADIEAICAPQMARLGYHTEGPPVSPLRRARLAAASTALGVVWKGVRARRRLGGGL